MFIIVRRRGQRIEIGDDISITVTEISRNLVKLGIEAPRTCLIARSELKESVALANHEAASCNLGTTERSILSKDAHDSSDPIDTPGAESFLLAPVKSLASADVNQATGKPASAK